MVHRLASMDLPRPDKPSKPYTVLANIPSTVGGLSQHHVSRPRQTDGTLAPGASSRPTLPRAGYRGDAIHPSTVLFARLCLSFKQLPLLYCPKPTTDSNTRSMHLPHTLEIGEALPRSKQQSFYCAGGKRGLGGGIRRVVSAARFSWDNLRWCGNRPGAAHDEGEYGMVVRM